MRGYDRFTRAPALRPRRRPEQRYDADFQPRRERPPREARSATPHWGWGPTGWVGMGPGMEFSPFAGVPYYGFGGEYRRPVRQPRESPTYGRGGDRAVRRWAGRYGYDLSYRVPPRATADDRRR